MNRPTPSFTRIFFMNNFLSLICALAIAFESFIVLNFDTKHGIGFFWATWLGLILGCILVVMLNIKRYRKIRLLIEQGYETKGKIINKYFYWSRGYITYEYKYHNQVYRNSENLVWSPISVRLLKNLKIEQEIKVTVNFEDPKQSLLSELYL